MSQLPASLQAGLTTLRQLPVDHPDFYAWYTLILRFLFPIQIGRASCRERV